MADNSKYAKALLDYVQMPMAQLGALWGTTPQKMSKALRQEGSNIYDSMKSAVTAPGRALQGQMNPQMLMDENGNIIQDESKMNQEGMNFALNFMGGGSSAPLANKQAASQLSGKGTLGIVPIQTAKKIDIPITLPKTPEFNAAVEGTTGANITPEGLSMSLQRFQKPEQELEQSVRTGVFYLPEGAAQTKYYKGSNSYGGKQAISGETLYKNPLFVKGATGGKAPEEAYKQLVGKDKFNEMQSDLQSVINANIYKPRTTSEEAYMFLEKHAPEIADDAWHIVENSKEGNQLRYALQEAVAANEARNAGHDVILGHSKGKNGPYLSEAFDLRESHYPSPSGEFYMHPQFEDLIK